MSWRSIHRWLGLVAGGVALLVAITGVVLALDPVLSAWQARPAADGMTLSTLVERVSRNVAGAEEIRRLPSGDIVVYAFDAGQPRAVRVDPADGRVLGDYQPSTSMRWFKNLHRSFLLGDAGRVAAAAVALSLLLLAAAVVVLLLVRAWRPGALR